MRYVLKVAYDGSAYCGWQTQKNAVSVQETMEKALVSAFGVNAGMTASGRTDSGVHALGQVCHVDLPLEMPADRLADAINAHLPADISVLASALAPAGFDANRSAKKKTYEYRLYFSPRRNPLMDRYAVRVKGAADAEKMKRALSLFVGEHDFAAYCASGSQVLTTVRTVYSASLTQREENGFSCMTVRICGNGFLYNMVRTMVGTALYFSLGRLTEEAIVRSLSEGDRSLVGKTMPPGGLTLKEVDYGFELFRNAQSV